MAKSIFPIFFLTLLNNYYRLEVLLFAIYLFLFTWIVTKTKFFVRSGISKYWLAGLFLIKVITGIVYGWLGIYEGGVARMNDTWTHHFNSLIQTQLLFNDPGAYFFGIFKGIEIRSVADFFASTNSYWNNLKWNGYIKLLSIFNCFSFGNYYINVIFYSFITFFGVVAIYRVMKAHLKAPDPVLITACFLVPSFLYWCSGLHKDGLTYLGIAVIIYIFYFYFINGVAKPRHYLLTALAFLMLFVFRNHVIVLLLPALAAWFIAVKMQLSALKTFMVIYTIAAVCFFGLQYLHPSLNLPAIVAEKHEAFRQLGGNTTVDVQNLEPTLKGFITYLPHASGLAVLRPYPGEIHKLLVLPAFLELVIIWVLVIAALYFSRKKRVFTPFGLFIFFFCVTMLLMIGYTQNNLGATVRYRSFLFPLFMPFILSSLYKYTIFKINYK